MRVVYENALTKEDKETNEIMGFSHQFGRTYGDVEETFGALFLKKKRAHLSRSTEDTWRIRRRFTPNRCPALADA